MLVAVTRAFVVTPLLSGAGRRSPVHVCCTTDEPAAPLPPDSFDSAEARGIELYQRGEHERAIRMFELAQTLPGAGIDYKREKQGGMIGSAFAPPNPREWAENRFATPEQKLIAQYNSKHKAMRLHPVPAPSQSPSCLVRPLQSRAAMRPWAIRRAPWNSSRCTSARWTIR